MAVAHPALICCRGCGWTSGFPDGYPESHLPAADVRLVVAYCGDCAPEPCPFELHITQSGERREWDAVLEERKTR
jgi:hypothetical protein